MLRIVANIIAAIAVMFLAFLGMVKAGGWYASHGKATR